MGHSATHTAPRAGFRPPSRQRSPPGTGQARSYRPAPFPGSRRRSAARQRRRRLYGGMPVPRYRPPQRCQVAAKTRSASLPPPSPRRRTPHRPQAAAVFSDPTGPTTASAAAIACLYRTTNFLPNRFFPPAIRLRFKELSWGNGRMSELRVVATGLCFPEGPVAMADGSVVLVEIERQTVSRVLPDGSVQVIAHTGGGADGPGARPGRALFVFTTR